MATIQHGTQFHDLTVIGEGTPVARKSGGFLATSRCKCVCGKETLVVNAYLKCGDTKSCGCRKRLHGHTDSPTYRSWVSMKNRCNPTGEWRAWYADRGIVICDRWRDFRNFLADMGERPDGMTIDRKDVNGNYELSNCRWATDIEQHNNRRDNLTFTFYGKKLTVAQWAKIAQTKPMTIYCRLDDGWPPKLAIWLPTQKRNAAKVNRRNAKVMA